MSKKRTAADAKQEVTSASSPSDATTDSKTEIRTEVNSDVKTETQPAKKSMLSRFNEPAPPPLRKIRGGAGGKGNSNLCRIQGVVMRAFDKPIGSISKKVVDIVVTNVIGNGAGDVVNTGVPGMDYIFPSSKIDSPETNEDSDNKFKVLAREINLDPTQIRKLNTFSTSFYKKGRDGTDSASVNAVDVGCLVEMSGVSIDAVVKGGETNFYRNAGKLTMLTDKAPSAMEVGAHMMGVLREPNMQAWAAFQTSCNANGWFDTSGLNDEQVKQANACQVLWKRLLGNAADRMAVMAQGKGDDEEAYFKDHMDRIRATNPQAVASGDVEMFLPHKWDKDIVPVLQSGMSPSNRVPGMIKALGGTIQEQASLPDVFAGQYLLNVGVQGKAVRLEAASICIFDRNSAIDAIDKGLDDPLLGTSAQRISFTVGLRNIGYDFGTLIESKASMAANELLWSAEFAAFPKMERIQDSASETSFPEGGRLFIDVPSTLRKSCVKVSREFIKTVLCGGLDAYIPVKQKLEGVNKLDFPTGMSELPFLVEHGYEELSSGQGFNLGNWEEVGDIGFYVLVEGTYAALAEHPDLATSTEKGEAFVKSLDGLDSNVKIRNHLASSGLVYAVKA